MRLPRPRARLLLELLAVAVGCGLLWRLEVELRGWAGTSWAWYWHHAVPLGATAVLAWVGRSDLAPRGWRRLGFLLCAAGVAAISLLFIAVVLTLVHATGPSSMLLPRLSTGAVTTLALMALLLPPAAAFAVARLWGVPLPGWTLFASLLAAALAPSASMQALALLVPRYAGDELHAIKTGCAVPFAVLAIGLPWALTPRRPAWG